MTRLKIYSHLLLSSKHYKFIYIFIFVLVYAYLNLFSLSYCMMEEPGSPVSDSDAILEVEGENVPPYSPFHPLYVAPEYPETAEAKQELASQSPILQEIESYTATQEQLLKRLNDQADLFARQEKMMTDRLSELMQERNDLRQQVDENRQEIAHLRHQHSHLLKKVYDDAYKVYMEHLNKNQEK